MKISNWIVLLVITISIAACSGTRHLPQGEILYTGLKKIRIKKIPDRDQTEWDLKKAGAKNSKMLLSIYDNPNGDLFGIPFVRFLPSRLLIYNWFYTEKDNGFSYWMMNNFGEPPTLISTVRPDLKVKEIENTLFNYGHFGARAEYKLHYNRKKNKARISYTFNIPRAYTFRNIELLLDSSQSVLRAPINNYREQMGLIKENQDFELDLLQQEKNQLWEYMQNSGYFYFDKEDFLILADTTVGYKQIDLRFQINKTLTRNQMQQVKVTSRVIAIDTIVDNPENKNQVINGGRKFLKPLILNKILSPTGINYSLVNNQKNLTNLNELDIFSNSNLKFNIIGPDSTAIQEVITLQTQDAFSLELNSDLALKNTGFVGPALGVNTNHLNVFGGAENLMLNASGYYDFPYGAFAENTSPSLGFLMEANLQKPLLNKVSSRLIKNSIGLPRQSLNIAFEYNNRTDFFKLANWKATYGISWHNSKKVSHAIDLININYNNLIRTTPQFDSLLAENDLLKLSFNNQLIIGSSYRFRYDNSATEDKRTGIFYESEIELSGNIMNAFFNLFGDKPVGERRILGVDYSQYIRLHSDFRFYYRLGRSENKLVFRNLIGVGKAYANSEVMPFIKQFFVGGTNSMRPINARNIGPGRYIELNPTAINQVGDLKLEVNLEYRFRIGGDLYGALWGDAGNVWLFEDDPDRPLSGIRWNKIIQDSYLTSGIGLRYDLKFLIARVDYGAVLYVPGFDDDFRWLWQNNLPLHGPVIGFGYPF